MKILLLDIETAPNLVHVWGLWQQNVGIPQIIKPGYTLCWAAKWLGSDDVYYDSIKKSSSKKMLKNIYKLISEADTVVHYNGTKFDMPTLNHEFLLAGFSPPAPYRQVDLLRTVRSQFRLPSNKLDFVAQFFGLGGKTKHEGHELWLGCMSGNKEDWLTMENYNINDVLLLEKVYQKLKPWIKTHPNHGLMDNTEVCPNCGSNHYHKRGFAYTHAGKYQRYRCTECGNWFRAKKNEKTNVFVNVN